MGKNLTIIHSVFNIIHGATYWSICAKSECSNHFATAASLPFYGKIYLACCIRYHEEHTVPLLGEDIVVIVDKKAKLILPLWLPG
jgi:hypothetical protein